MMNAMWWIQFASTMLWMHVMNAIIMYLVSYSLQKLSIINSWAQSCDFWIQCCHLAHHYYLSCYVLPLLITEWNFSHLWSQVWALKILVYFYLFFLYPFIPQARNLKAKDINGKSGDWLNIYYPDSLFLSLRPLCEGVAPVWGEEGGEEEDHGLQVQS